MYSFSTCWNSHRHTDGRSMLKEIKELGFDYAELSHGIRLSLLPGVLESVNAGEIKISTLHNFCPLPIGIKHAAPNIFKFTSPNARERENAFRHTMKTLETAEKVQARLVVLHMGCLEIKDYTAKLIQMVEKGKRDHPKFERICMEAIEKREKKKESYCEFAYELLEQIADQAAAKGLHLGIENREALEEIPFESDFSLFFKRFPQSNIRYWHDCGHAQIKESLGFINHAMHLESLAERLAGFHIHDVEYPARDHRPPGKGCIKFETLQPFVRADHIKVFELSPGLDKEDVLQGIQYLKSVWGEE